MSLIQRVHEGELTIVRIVDIEHAAQNRPAGYIDDVLSHAAHVGEHVVWLPRKAMAELRTKYRPGLTPAERDELAQLRNANPRSRQQLTRLKALHDKARGYPMEGVPTLPAASLRAEIAAHDAEVVS